MSHIPTGIPGTMAPGMQPGFAWGGHYPMMGDMANMMFNQAAMMPSNGVNSNNETESRSRRRSRSKERSRSRDRSDDRRGTKRKSDKNKTEAPIAGGHAMPGINPQGMNPQGMNPQGMNPQGMTPQGITPQAINPQGMNPQGMNPMMGMMQGNVMPMAGGMYPHNMMMSGYPTNMLPTTNMDMSASSLEMMGQAQMEMMNSTGTDMNVMVPMMDPNMMGMTMGVQMGGDVKELVLQNCKLTPPPIGTPLPPRRIKPPGCRTIFIGGLPEKTKEDHVREIFERFGRIYTLRLSKKDFCHIRYDRENSVDMAIALSGYKLRLFLSGKADEEDPEDKGNSGWLHVDYALSRDDQNDFERKQKRLEREAQRELSATRPAEMSASRSHDQSVSRSHDLSVSRSHDLSASRSHDLSARPHDMSGSRAQEMPSRRRERRARSPSPAPIQPYSNLIVAQVSEKIRSEEHFESAVPTLAAWLERGECQKKNAPTFYAMIQATNGQIRRIFNEKIQVDEDFQYAKDKAKTSYCKIISQLEQVAKVLTAATHQRVWDHFTKPQRKNIETWQKMTEEFQSIKDEFNEKFGDEDNENGEERSDISELKKLRKERDDLRVQMEAYKNEVELLKEDSQRDFEKWKAQFIATHALSNMNQDGKHPPPPPPPLAKPPPPPPLPPLDDDDKMKESVPKGCGEAKLIGVISAFLQVHPRGASLDYVSSYVRAEFPAVSAAAVRAVLEKHSDVFRVCTSGVGAGIELRWMFVAFNN